MPESCNSCDFCADISQEEDRSLLWCELGKGIVNPEDRCYRYEHKAEVENNV